MRVGNWDAFTTNGITYSQIRMGSSLYLPQAFSKKKGGYNSDRKMQPHLHQAGLAGLGLCVLPSQMVVPTKRS